MICFHFTIFVVLETTGVSPRFYPPTLWFAFILLSLSYWKQLFNDAKYDNQVVICFHFTIFVVLETTHAMPQRYSTPLWFAFILLSLSYWKQLSLYAGIVTLVVICFHFTIFVVLETTLPWLTAVFGLLWFAFILLSLSYWKQRKRIVALRHGVVICFHFTIFVVLETTTCL